MVHHVVARALALSIATALCGCYSQPAPDCGFICGQAGECPPEYTCERSVARCVHVEAPPSTRCQKFPGGPYFDARAQLDVFDGPGEIDSSLPPIDASIDASIDAR